MDNQQAHPANSETSHPAPAIATVFDDLDSAAAAIAELRQNGFDPHNIGMAYPSDSRSAGPANAGKRETVIPGMAGFPGWTMGMPPFALSGSGPTVVLGSLSLARRSDGPDDLRGFLSSLGLSADLYRLIEARLSRGAVLVAVNAEGKDAIARNILERNGGHSLHPIQT